MPATLSEGREDSKASKKERVSNENMKCVRERRMKSLRSTFNLRCEVSYRGGGSIQSEGPYKTRGAVIVEERKEGRRSEK